MDIEEVSRRYGVSCAFLKEYKSWKLTGDQNEKTPLQFDDRDMANICLAVTLRDIGFQFPMFKSIWNLNKGEIFQGRSGSQCLNA